MTREKSRLKSSFCVYLISNSVTNDSYVGCTTVGAHRRFKQHMRSKNHKHFTFAVVKYGVESFSYKILQEYSNFDEMLAGEIHWISVLRPTYNLTLGGEGLCGLKHTDATKALISIANSGEKHWAYGKKHTDEARARMKLNSSKGKKLSLEQVELRRKNAMGNTANLGRKFTAEHKAKISAKAKGRKHSPESIEKMRIAQKARILLRNSIGSVNCA